METITSGNEARTPVAASRYANALRAALVSALACGKVDELDDIDDPDGLPAFSFTVRTVTHQAVVSGLGNKVLFI